MPLTAKQKKELKKAAHHLKPVIRIGQHGVSEGVVAETHCALDTHELIKVHMQQGDKDARQAAAESLCQQTHAECVHHIGKVWILYRQRKEEQKA